MIEQAEAAADVPPLSAGGTATSEEVGLTMQLTGCTTALPALKIVPANPASSFSTGTW
jgi:hypothetical protein